MAHDVSAILGRWDLTVGEGEGQFPSWLEVTQGESGLTGRFVGIWGSSRPVHTVVFEGNQLLVSLPPQYEGFPGHQIFSATYKDDQLCGVTNTREGGVITWSAKRQAPLPFRDVTWGEPKELIGEGLTGWVPRSADATNYWTNEGGALVNTGVGSDLVTVEKFQDFKLVAEYSYPENSNSGIYLRGRYEFQVLDDHGQEPSVGASGAIYGFLVPSSNPVKPHGERNVVEITLIGRTVTVVLNGVTIHDQLEIPGITGGALDSDEGVPGPLFIQGDHGPVTYHRLTLTPAL